MPKSIDRATVEAIVDYLVKQSTDDGQLTYETGSFLDAAEDVAREFGVAWNVNTSNATVPRGN